MINYKYVDCVHQTDYLMHHGVKGMKWGVRNEDTKRRYFQLTEKGKNREYTKDVIIKNKIKENRKNKIKGFDQNRSSYQLTTGVNDNPYLLKSKGVIIPKGSKLARVGSYTVEKNTTKPAYYSITKNDRQTYLATNRAKAIAAKAGVQKLNRWGGTYEYSPVVKEDIIAPCKKEARKILGESIREAYKTNVERDTFNYRSNMRKENSIKRYGTNKSIDKAIKTGVANDRLLKSISNVMGAGTTKEIRDSQKVLGKKSKTLNDIFKKNLQEKGYNAVKDYNDAYNPAMASRSPLIVLNKKKTVGNPKGKHILKQSEVKNMEYDHIGYEPPSNYLMHHGVKGMKWGVRNEERRARDQARQSSNSKTLIGNIVGLPRLGTTGAVRRETVKNMTKAEHQKYNTARKISDIASVVGVVGSSAGKVASKNGAKRLGKIASTVGKGAWATAVGSGLAEFAIRRNVAKKLGYVGKSESAENKRKKIREQNSLLRSSGINKALNDK